MEQLGPTGRISIISFFECSSKFYPESLIQILQEYWLILHEDPYTFIKISR
jgi:hypothetical protein